MNICLYAILSVFMLLFMFMLFIYVFAIYIYFYAIYMYYASFICISQAEEEAEKKPKILIVKENITSDVLVVDITPPSKQAVKTSKKK